jgi:hypothetical protein
VPSLVACIVVPIVSHSSTTVMMGEGQSAARSVTARQDGNVTGA